MGLLEEKLSIQFCDEDALFFSHYLRGDRIEVLSYNHIEEENRIIYQRILEKISSIINIQMSMEDDLVKEFVMHMNAMVYRLKHNITINNPLLEDIRKELGPLFNVIMMVVVSETSHLGIRISEDEIGYLTIHVQNIMEQQKKGRNILLVCPHGNVTANLILHQLKEILPAYNMFETISMNRITKVNLDSVDFIISTVDLPKLAKPVIRISPIVSNDDLMNITTFYQRMMIHDSLDHLTYPRLKAMLDEKYVFEYPNASKEEVLEQVLSILQEDGIVTKEYKESVYKREEIYSTDNAFLVAIPHGDIRHVKETKLVFAVLPKKKKWKKYYVNLVIFFNINQKDLSYSKDILEDIYKLMHSEQFGRLCREGITKEKLMKYILEGTI